VASSFLKEYSHSSAPEVFLAAASQRTSRIRLGRLGPAMEAALARREPPRSPPADYSFPAMPPS
jgi:hypothetical protein